jgi:hypothetical protein
MGAEGGGLLAGDGRADNLLIVWTGGEVTWKNDFDWDRNTALPATLAGVFKGEEPNFACKETAL